MANSGIMTLPLLRGTVVLPSAWATLFTRAYMRVYPYQLGCMVRTTVVGGTDIPTHGLGEFAAGEYIMICSEVSYGDSSIFIPDPTRIARVSVVSTAEDLLSISAALTVYAGEYILNTGSKLFPDTSGSAVSPLYTDNVGNSENANDYLATGSDGQFKGWVPSGYELVDLLVTDESGTAKLVIPFYPLGPEIIQ